MIAVRCSPGCGPCGQNGGTMTSTGQQDGGRFVQFRARLSSLVYSLNQVNAGRGYDSCSLELAATISLSKGRVLPLVPCQAVKKLLSSTDICRRSVVIQFLQPSLRVLSHFFCSKPATLLRFRSLPRVTLCNKVRVGLASVECACSLFGSLAHRGGLWRQNRKVWCQTVAREF